MLGEHEFANGHDICNIQGVEVNAHIKDPTQVTIGEDPFDFHQGVTDYGHPHIFARNFQQRVAQRCIFTDMGSRHRCA